MSRVLFGNGGSQESEVAVFFSCRSLRGSSSPLKSVISFSIRRIYKNFHQINLIILNQ